MNNNEIHAMEMVKKNDTEGAIQLYKEALRDFLSLNDPLSASRVCMKLAELTEKVDAKGAETFHQQAWIFAERASEDGSSSLEWPATVCEEYGCYLENQSREWEAIEMLSLSLDHLDTALQTMLEALEDEDSPEPEASSIYSVMYATRQTLAHFNALSEKLAEEVDQLKQRREEA